MKSIREDNLSENVHFETEVKNFDVEIFIADKYKFKSPDYDLRFEFPNGKKLSWYVEVDTSSEAIESIRPVVPKQNIEVIFIELDESGEETKKTKEKITFKGTDYHFNWKKSGSFMLGIKPESVEVREDGEAVIWFDVL